MLRIGGKDRHIVEGKAGFLKLRETVLQSFFKTHNIESQEREKYTMQRLTKSELVSSVHIT